MEQKCQATKQVQMISMDPPMYRSTYYGRHTCKNLLNSPQIIGDPEDEDAKNLVSFGSNAASSQNNNPFFSSLGFGSIKEEHKQETVPEGYHTLFHTQPPPPPPSDCNFPTEYWPRELDQLEDFMPYASYRYIGWSPRTSVGTPEVHLHYWNRWASSTFTDQTNVCSDLYDVFYSRWRSMVTEILQCCKI